MKREYFYTVYFKANDIREIVSTDKNLCYYTKKYLPVKCGQLENCYDDVWGWNFINTGYECIQVLNYLLSHGYTGVSFQYEYQDDCFADVVNWATLN